MQISFLRQKFIGPMALSFVTGISACSEPATEQVSAAIESSIPDIVTDLAPANEVQIRWTD